MPAHRFVIGVSARNDPAFAAGFRAFPPRRHALAAASALAVGCGSAAPVSPAPAPRPVPAAFAIDTELDRAWGERDIAEVPALVTLPDAAGWHASTSGTFVVLEHARTHSRLTLRVTLAPRIVRPEQCEKEARLARPSLPSTADSSSVVERRAIAAPVGFDVRLVVGVEPAENGVHGFALAVGAATSRCYVAAFETQSRGPKAAEVVADRLALAVSGILETMRLRSADRAVSPPMGVK